MNAVTDLATSRRVLAFPLFFLWLCLLSPVQAQLPTRLGDLDADGQPTVLDLVRLINHLNGRAPISGPLLPFADVNESGAINQADVDLVADAILGIAPLPDPYAPPIVNLPTTATNGSSILITGVSRPNRIITVQGGQGVVAAVAGANGVFTINVLLQSNRLNTLQFTASNSTFTAGTPQPLRVIQDSEPPSLYIDFPTNGQTLFTSSTVIAGRVGDMLSGFMGLNVFVHASPAEGAPPAPGVNGGVRANVNVGIGNNGTFERNTVPLSEGTNLVTVSAADVLGNRIVRQVSVVYAPLTNAAPRLFAVSGDLQMTNIHRRLARPLLVRATQSDGVTPFAGKLISLDVTRSDGRLLPVNFDALANPAVFTNDITRTGHGVMSLQLFTDENGAARAWWAMGGDAGCGNNRVCAMSAGIPNPVYFCASAKPLPVAQINIGTGSSQKAEVGAFVADPLRAWASDGCNGVTNLPVTFTITQGGGKLVPSSGGGGQSATGTNSVTVLTSGTGHAEVLLQLGTEPGPNIVEASYAGNPGPAATFIASGIARDPAQPTTFTGLVLDNAGQPIGGALCRLFYPDGSGLSTSSDAQGHFTFHDAIPGPSDLNILGNFATSLGTNAIPPGSFPTLSYTVILVPNAENSLPRPVLLPRLNPANARTYFGTNDLVLSCEGLAGLKMTIKANSMRRPDGVPVTPQTPVTVSLNQVHHDDVPMPIPDGAAPPFAWTLQPGRSTFDPPIEIEYPNMTGLPAGSIAYFLSFNHDTERFEIVASGHVKDDGALIVTDPGGGLSVAGWGCNCPPYSVTANCCKAPADGCKTCQNNMLVNQPDGTPGDDGDSCTDNDRCQGGKAMGDPPGGTSPCSGGSGAYVTVYSETMSAAGGNFARMDSVQVDGQACYDAASRTYKFNVDSRGHHGLINLTLGGAITSTEPNPVVGGNVTISNYCAIIADMADYQGPNGGRGAWHTLAASRAHEEYHRDVDFKALFDARWPAAAAQLGTISVSCENPFGTAIAQGMANAFICQFQMNVLNDLNTFNTTHNAQTSDGAYGAGQAVLNGVIQQVRDFAAAQGWPACAARPAPGFGFAGAAGPRLINLVATPNRAKLAAAQSVQATVMGQFDNGNVLNLTPGASGTVYVSGNPAVARVTADGLITAVSPGYVNIVVTHSPGVDLLPLIAVIEIMVISPDDRDGDFIPNVWETAFGFNPDNAADAAQDADGDGLSNLNEFLRATDPHNPDTDGDGLLDGLEVDGGQDPLRPPVLDANWQVAVNGQAVQVNPDGSFTIPNVSAADLFGAGGPGTAPDFLSDDFVRVTGQGKILGKTYYVFSEPFQFRGRQTFSVTNLIFTPFPPLLPESLRAIPDNTVLTALGQKTQVRVTATLSGGGMVDATPRTRWTVYRTSNPTVATVEPDGLVTAHAQGMVFITAVNDGVTSVCQIDVAPGDPLTSVIGYVQTTNGVPVAGVTINVLGLAANSVVSSADGSFLITNVPTAFGPFRVAARLLTTTALFGTSGVLTPVPAGITDAGILTLKQGVAWIGGASGVWHGATNWSTGQVPGPTNDVYISAPPGVTVTISQGSNVVNTILIDTPLRLSGGTFRANGVIQANVPITLAGGTIFNSTILAGSLQPVISATASDGRLNGVTVNGDVDLSVTDALLRVAGVNTFNGVVSLSGSDARLISEGNATINTAGGGQIVFAGTAGSVRHLGHSGVGTLTLGPGLLVHGGRANIGQAHFIGGAFSLTNRGTILADVSGQILTVMSEVNPFVNLGTVLAEDGGSLTVNNLTDAAGLRISGGGTLTLAGNWTNTGAVVADDSILTLAGSWNNAGAINFINSVLNLGGTYTLANLGALNRSGGVVNVTGTLNLGGGILTLGSGSGSWTMVNGTISGGTVNLTGGAQLLITANDGRLSGVTVNGNLDLAVPDALLRLAGVVTFNGVVTVSGSNARLISEGNVTLNTAGAGEIVFSGTTGNLRHLGHSGVGSLTLGPGLLVHGGRANLGQAHFVGGSFSITNRGTILADVSGQTLTVMSEVNPFVNLGFVRASNGANLSLNNLKEAAGLQISGGGTLTLDGDWSNSGALTVNASTLTLAGTWTNNGTINFTNSVVNLGGAFTLANLGTLNRSGGTVNVTGALNLGGGILTLNAMSGLWTMVNGTISSGTLNLMGGAMLIITPSDGRLNGVTVNGNLDLSSPDALLRVAGVVTFNGVVTLSGSNARLLSEGNATVNTTAAGEILFSGTAGNVRHLGHVGVGTLTLGPGLLVHGGRANLGQAHFVGGSFSLTNRGTIMADVSGQTLTVMSEVNPFVNLGTVRGQSGGSLVVNNLREAAGVQMSGGGTLTLDGNWGNSGTLTVNASMLTLAGSWTNSGAINFTNTVLNLGGSFTLANLGTLNRSGGTVNVTGSFNLGGGTLTLNPTSGSWNMVNGTISAGTINQLGGAMLLITAADGRLNGVIVNGNLDFSVPDALLRVAGVVSFNGVVTLSGSNARLLSEGNATLTTAGGGEIVFAGTAGSVRHLGHVGVGSLTLGPGLLVHGGRANLGQAHFIGGSFSMTNRGTILADVSGQILTVMPEVDPFVNLGSIRADNGASLSLNNLAEAGGVQINGGGTLTLGGDWANTGAIIANASTLTLTGTWTNFGTINFTNTVLNLGGNFVLSNLGALNRSGGTVNVTGGLNLAGGTLTLNAASGSWTMVNGTISGGTLNLTGGASLLITASDGRLSGVTVNGNLDLSAPDAVLRVTGVVGFNGVVTLSGSNARLLSEGNATINTAGGGQIVFAGTTGSVRHLGHVGASTLTLGPGLLVHGGRANIGQAQFIGGTFSLTNRGTLLADVSGQTIAVVSEVTPFVNLGTVRGESGASLSLNDLVDAAGVQMSGGGTLTLDGNWGNTGALTINASTLTLGGSWTNSGAINFTNSVLNLGGSFTLANLGTLNRSAGTVNVTGGLNLNGGTLTLNPTSGSWTMVNGTISGGTVNLTGGAALLTTAGDGRLNGVTLNGNLDLSAQDALLRVAGVVTFNGVVTLSGSNARLVSEGNATINTAGGGAIVFAGPAGSVRHLGHVGVGTLTLGPGLLVHGGRANLGQAHFIGGSFSLTNRGTILADVNGQTLSVVTEVNPFVNLGTVRAENGAISLFNLTNIAGTLIAGTNGVITINGNFPQSAGSTIEVHLAGTSSTQFGRISVTGTAILTGALNVIRDNGYLPNFGDRFRFMTFAGRSGLFTTTGGFNIGGGMSFSLDTTDATDLELVVGP